MKTIHTLLGAALLYAGCAAEPTYNERPLPRHPVIYNAVDSLDALIIRTGATTEIYLGTYNDSTGYMRGDKPVIYGVDVDNDGSVDALQCRYAKQKVQLCDPDSFNFIINSNSLSRE